MHRKHNNLFYKTSNGTQPCGYACALCPFMMSNDHFQDINGKKYYTKGSISCDTNNIVYGIYCKKCDKAIYVGETMNTTYQRHQLNISRIRTGRNVDPVVAHFRQENHSVGDYNIFGIEKISKDTEYRKVRELFWINKLKTFKPFGINVKNH